LHFVLATSWLDPIVNAIWYVIAAIDKPIHSLGWSLILLALAIKVLFWGLNTAQFKAMINMQKVAPRMKALQTKYSKEDPQRYQQEMSKLYKEEGVNPLAGCWPMLVQYPVIISVYYAVLQHSKLFQHENWGWIGTAMSQHSPKIFGVGIFAANLAAPDVILIVLYAISMYFYSRYATMPASDPQQAQTQKMMAIVSPLMLGFFGFRFHWPSAMVLYWFAYNVFTMAQQFYLLRKYHQPLTALDSEHAVTEGLPVPANDKTSRNGFVAGAPRNANTSKKKKGAKK
jgi:YidC/Oxa1 family membrane protein insertase